MANLLPVAQTTSQFAVYPQDETLPCPFAYVPVEMCLFILSKLESAKDLLSFGLACRSFNLISGDETLWKFLYENHFPYKGALKPSQATGTYQSLYKKYDSFERNTRNFGPAMATKGP